MDNPTLQNHRVNSYYTKIIDLIIELHNYELTNATNGHCMKITGLSINELDYLWDIIKSKYAKIDAFIISDNESTSNKFITASKLIEYRNQQEKPLLILIPSNIRTAAEDSYGNATFKEISLEGIERKLKDRLIHDIPSEFQRIIKEDIFNYLDLNNSNTTNIINYLIALDQKGFNKENIGNFIYFFGLIPDSKLLLEEEKIRFRLNKNKISSELLSSFEKPLYARIEDLPIEPNTLQKDLVAFIKSENHLKSIYDLASKIYSDYPELNFNHWKIPDLNFNHLKLIVEEIKSNSIKVEQDVNVLRVESNNISTVKIRFTTTPNPKEIAELKYFKIVLMEVNGGAGEEITTLRKLKNTLSNRPYREAIVELNPNLIEEGSYFFKVLAEDEEGNILNYDDDFKDLKIQNYWDKSKSERPDISKSSFNYKLSCDSEDFDYIIEEELERKDDIKKSKLNNVLQAFFKFRIGLLKSGEEKIIPIPSENSNVWIKDEKSKLNSIFHINYSDNHNYQINVSTKLRNIENIYFQNSETFGHLEVRLNSNSSIINFNSIHFVPSEITAIVPNPILKLRKEIFAFIQNSNENRNGIFETANIFEIKEDIKKYIQKLTNWTTELKTQISNNELQHEEKNELQQFLTELQLMDVIKIKTKLANGQPVDALLLSPLHPLRLAWFGQLMEVFENWEQKTKEYSGYISSWSNTLNGIFDGTLSPQNNPLALVDPLSNKGFQYSGELSYGWGLYIDVNQNLSGNSMTSISRQLNHFFRELFNVSANNFVETDLSYKIVVRHIKSYLLQHPYTDKVIINLINAGDANVFADALVNLEKEQSFKNIKYEIRIFKGDDKIIEHGQALKNLINPEYNVSEEAESFSQPSQNRLFPKLRFSINTISDYLSHPSKFTAHLSFLISPFPVKIELIKSFSNLRNFYLNGLLADTTISVLENKSERIWNRYLTGNILPIKYNGGGEIGVKLFDNIQTFISGALASGYTESIPSTQLRLHEKDNVLLNHLHDYSDWVITFDKNLGPQIFDQPSNNGQVPFLLDYIPGEEVSGISSYLTTRPTSEVMGLLGPHFREFNLDIHNSEDEKKIKNLLEDIRAVSSSLILQLNSSKNKAFEVIGTAFAKRILEKKGLLDEAFMIPIDLHQNLFENLPSESKSRADNLLVSIDPSKKEISITVLEIKCRKSIGITEKEELKVKMKEQIANTIEAFRSHFDTDYNISFDRLDREVKNKELKSLLGFYIDRANRYNYLSDNAYNTYTEFLQYLDKGFKFNFSQLGLIFDFSARVRHQKEIVDSELTFFTFGHNLIEEIIDPDSDLNTKRLEEKDLDNELNSVIGKKNKLKPFIQKYKQKQESIDSNETPVEIITDRVKIEDLPPAKSGYNETAITYVWPSLTTSAKNMNSDNNDYEIPKYDILIGKNSESNQFGLLGETMHGKKIAIDLSETNTFSLFGIQGGGKSYTIGTVSEMVLKQFSHINNLPSPLAGVIFHYSESMDYEPEFTSMIYPNDNNLEMQKLKERYGAEPDNIEDVIILTPKDKVQERQNEYPSIEVMPIAFNSNELNIQDWLFILGAVGNDSAYIKQLKAIMKDHRSNITIEGILNSVNDSLLLSNSQKSLAKQKLSFASEYINDNFTLKNFLKPGRLIIVDLRDEFIVKDEALGLFVIMLNIFSGVKKVDGQHFNKFIVFDEAHKYMDNRDLTGNIVTAIREMRHKGVSIMIASQDPPSLPNEIIELSSVVLLHKFNSPQWLKHVQKSITQLSSLKPEDMSTLSAGEGFLWATKASERMITARPIKISTRPRVTKHGGATIQATGDK